MANDGALGSGSGTGLDAGRLKRFIEQTIRETKTKKEELVFGHQEVIGDASTTVFPIIHGLDSSALNVEIIDQGTLAIERDWSAGTGIGLGALVSDDNVLTLTFAVAPTLGQYRVVVVAV